MAIELMDKAAVFTDGRYVLQLAGASRFPPLGAQAPNRGAAPNAIHGCRSRRSRDIPHGMTMRTSATERPTSSCCSHRWKAGGTSR